MGHEDNVLCVSFSPDGRTLASGTSDKTVAIWDVPTGKLRFRLRGHNAEVTSVTFSPTGEIVSSFSWDDTVKLWDTSTGQLLDTFPLEATSEANRSSRHAISPNGEMMTVARLDGTVVIWNLKTRESKTLDADKDSLFVTVHGDRRRQSC